MIFSLLKNMSCHLSGAQLSEAKPCVVEGSLPPEIRQRE